MLEAQTQDRPPPKVNGAGEGGWTGTPIEPARLDGAELAAWHETRAAVRALAEGEGWSMGEVSRRSGISQGTLSPWYSGKYAGDMAKITAQVRRWLSADAERRSVAPALRVPDFVETPTVQRVMTALLVAQELPGMVLITLGAGMGKTTAVERVLTHRPNTYAITLSPSTRSVTKVLREVAMTINVQPHAIDLRARIGASLRRAERRTLLMVDEAQNLGEDAVNELRHFLDRYGCGIALLGNDDVHTRWGRARPEKGHGQLNRRFADRVRLLEPDPRDIELYVAAWGIQDPDVVRLLGAIGRRPGALGQVAETVKYASILAAGAGRPNAITADDVRRAWANRGDEVLR